MTDSEPWWRSAVVYQVYPRSFADTPTSAWADGGAAYRQKHPDRTFADTNGDGIGDLRGVTEHLDHIAGLGADAVWLSPFFTSPQVDFGYDISDYCDVDPDYGTLADADELIAAAHARGLRVVIDGVYNHTSEQHPWFVESRSSRTNPKADWYVWADGRGRRPPNNWRSVDLVHTGWYFDEGRGQWYLATFDRCQPDLNWQNPEVRAAMFDAIGFWLDRGVDGIRLDMFGQIMKDPGLRPEPIRPRLSPDLEKVRLTDRSHTLNTDANYRLARDLRRFCIERRGGDDVMLVGECFGLLDEVSRYTVGGDGLTHSFLFDVLGFRFDAGWFRDAISRYESAFPWPQDPAYVFENHDRTRLVDRVGGDLAKARVLAVLLCTVRGQATIYQGQEIGMANTYIPLKEGLDTMAKRFAWLPEAVNRRLPERINRDEVRTPMQWDGGPHAGFTGPDATPWLRVHPDAHRVNVAAQTGDPGSMLELYRRLLALRRERPVLRHGRLDLAPTTGGVLGYLRSDGADRVLVVANMGTTSEPVGVGGPAHLLVASDGAVAVDGSTVRLPPSTAAVLALG